MEMEASNVSDEAETIDESMCGFKCEFVSVKEELYETAGLSLSEMGAGTGTGTAPFEQVLMEEVRAESSGLLDESDADPLSDHFAMNVERGLAVGGGVDQLRVQEAVAVVSNSVSQSTRQQVYEAGELVPGKIYVMVDEDTARTPQGVATETTAKRTGQVSLNSKEEINPTSNVVLPVRRGRGRPRKMFFVCQPSDDAFPSEGEPGPAPPTAPAPPREMSICELFSEGIPRTRPMTTRERVRRWRDRKKGLYVPEPVRYQRPAAKPAMSGAERVRRHRERKKAMSSAERTRRYRERKKAALAQPLTSEEDPRAALAQLLTSEEVPRAAGSSTERMRRLRERKKAALAQPLTSEEDPRAALAQLLTSEEVPRAAGLSTERVRRHRERKKAALAQPLTSEEVPRAAGSSTERMRRLRERKKAALAQLLTSEDDPRPAGPSSGSVETETSFQDGDWQEAFFRRLAEAESTSPPRSPPRESAPSTGPAQVGDRAARRGSSAVLPQSCRDTAVRETAASIRRPQRWAERLRSEMQKALSLSTPTCEAAQEAGNVEVKVEVDEPREETASDGVDQSGERVFFSTVDVKVSISGAGLNLNAVDEDSQSAGGVLPDGKRLKTENGSRHTESSHRDHEENADANTNHDSTDGPTKQATAGSVTRTRTTQETVTSTVDTTSTSAISRTLGKEDSSTAVPVTHHCEPAKLSTQSTPSTSSTSSTSASRKGAGSPNDASAGQLPVKEETATDDDIHDDSGVQEELSTLEGFLGEEFGSKHDEIPIPHEEISIKEEGVDVVDALRSGGTGSDASNDVSSHTAWGRDNPMETGCGFKENPKSDGDKLEQDGRWHPLRCSRPTCAAKTFSSAYHLAAHVRAHETRDAALEPFQCSQCKERFYFEEELRCHEPIHHEPIHHEPIHHEPIDTDSLKKKKKVYERKHSRMEHMQKPRDEDAVRCAACNRIFFDEAACREHIHTRHHGTSQKLFQCTKCEMRFVRMAALRSHLKAHAVKAAESRLSFRLRTIDMRTQRGGPRFKCGECDRSFFMPAHVTFCMRRHQAEKRFQCGECDARFGHKSALAEHMAVHARDFECALCSQKFVSKPHFLEHMRDHTEKEPMRCCACSRRFPGWVELMQHVQRHREPMDLECAECSQLFPSESSLSEHMRTHRATVFLRCALCRQKFSKKAIFYEHMRIHTEKEPYHCSECDARFSEESLLAEHIERHVAEYPSKCNVCDERFLNMDGLCAHMKVHDVQVEPLVCEQEQCGATFEVDEHVESHIAATSFCCPECKQRFTDPSSLAAHMLIHTQIHAADNPFACGECSQRFVEESLLQDHMSKCHHADNLFVCQECNRRFSTGDLLQEHVTADHVQSRNLTTASDAMNGLAAERGWQASGIATT